MKDLLKIAFNDDTDKYEISIPQGSSLEETAFCVSVVIRAFVRDGIIKSNADFLQLLTKYLDDPQYDEVKNEN